MPVNQVLKEEQGSKPKTTKKAPLGWGSGASAGSGMYQPTGAGRGYGANNIQGSPNPATPVTSGGSPVYQNQGATHVVGAQRTATGQATVQMNGQPQAQVIHGPNGPQTITFRPPNMSRPQNTGAAHVAGTTRATDGQAPQVEGFTQPEPGVQLGSGDANNSMSDTLRSMAAGNYGPTMIPWMTPPQTQQPKGFGFGTQYRGWGGGGDGGGYGGGYGNGANNPWINYMMGLNNWQI